MRARFINESLNNIFKPKSEDEVKEAFEKQHPEFVKLANKFVNGEYKVEIKGINQKRSGSFFTFSIKDDNQKEYIFLISQSSFLKDEAPTIGYLDKRMSGNGIGGAFIMPERVRTIKHVNDYIERMINIFNR
jgi:hypothetical protein